MKQFYFLSLLVVTCVAKAQIVNIPDANFKNALINTLCVAEYSWEPATDDADTNNDGEIQLSEAAAVQCLKLANQNIASLEGIGNFTNLMFLVCPYNQLTSLTVTNPSLVLLDCSHYQLTSLTTDFINSCDYETTLDCSYNNLTSVNLPADPFYFINCSFNQMTEFTLPPGTGVQYLSLDGNLFTTFDSATVSYMTHLSLSDCPLLTTATVRTESAWISENPQLVSLVLGSDGEYTVTNNPVLQSISVKDGYYGYIDGDFPDPHYTISDNPMLEFVCMDDIGAWYYEGEWFFQTEMMNLYGLQAGVNKTFYCDLTPGGTYNTIAGTIHFDCGGGNVAVDNGDVQINLDEGNNGSINAVTGPTNNGSFVFYTNNSGIVMPSFGNDYFTVTPPSQTYSFNGSFEMQVMDFCVSPNGVHPDLEVSLIPLVPARPGFDAVYKIVYRNAGTEIQSGTLSFNFEDDKTDLVSAVPEALSQSVNLLSWDFAGLNPFETREIIVTLNVNSSVESPAVNNGDLLHFTAALTTALVDQTPANNTFMYDQIVVGSFDPNDKAVSRESIGISQLGDYLYYTVRFQNTGTYQAENVVIRDILSKKLDASTFEVVATSHSARSLVTRAATANDPDKLEIFFEGINLPASQNNEPGSHGFATFRIKPKNNVVLDDVITNKAEIYFDFNSAIATNTVSTTVVALGLEDQIVNLFAIFPNPAKHTVTITLQNDAPVQSLVIYNLLGQQLKAITPNFENREMTIDISQFETGTYLLQIASGQSKTTRKLIKS